jgi:hypothetical protein
MFSHVFRKKVHEYSKVKSEIWYLKFHYPRKFLLVRRECPVMSGVH